MLRFSFAGFLRALIPALLAIYIVVRIGENTFSWKVPPPANASVAVVAGDRYAALLAGQENPGEKIRTLWDLSTQPAWLIPNWSGDPLPLARNMAQRALSYAQAGNVGQAASHVKILLQWANNLLSATGPGAIASRALDLAEIAVNTLSACPGTLQYTALHPIAETLANSLRTSSRTRVDNLLSELAASEAETRTRNLMLLANRNRLREDLLDTLEGDRRHLTRITIMSWLYVCPRNPKLLRQSLAELDAARIKSQELYHQLETLLAETRPPLPQ